MGTSKQNMINIICRPDCSTGLRGGEHDAIHGCTSNGDEGEDY
jgi:hypothetical protein